MNPDSEGEEQPGTDRLLHRRDAMDTARQSRNQRQEGLTADYADYAENRLPPGSPSVYSAVYLFPEAASPPAKNFDCCSAENANKAKSLRLARCCGLIMALSVSIGVHLWLELGGSKL
jgi:hypothetical protein